MNLKPFRINRQIQKICKIVLCVFCFSIIFYFDVLIRPWHSRFERYIIVIYLSTYIYLKITHLELLSRSSLEGSNSDDMKFRRLTTKFHEIRKKLVIDDKYRTFKSLEEERIQMKEFNRIYAEYLKRQRLDKIAVQAIKAEYDEDYSTVDDEDEGDDDNDDDDDDSNDEGVLLYKSVKDDNKEVYEYVEEIDTSEIEYQLKGEKLPSVILPPGLLQLGRLYSLFHYLKGLIPTSEKEPIGWEKGISRRTIDYIDPDMDTSFTHFSKDICVVKKPLILIMICSRPRNVFLRQSIRSTWARYADQYNVKVLFFIGIPANQRIEVKMLEESNLRRDLILENFDDTYNNLTLKTIFMLKWVQMYCAEVPFVLKLDDDVYVNLENLYKYVIHTQKSDTSKLLVGKVGSKAKPIREETHKWYMPYYLYKYEYFPNYTEGVGYLMSKQVALLLYKYSLTKEFIHLEDVFLTGMCAQELNITPVNQEEFQFTTQPNIGCDNKLFSKLVLIAHKVKVFDMYKIHYRALSCSVVLF